MIPKLDILRRITEAGLVAVVRAESGAQARRVADAVLAGGCPAVEMTFTVPGAHRVIEEMAKAYHPSELILGAGTVLDPETARIAILSGASYVVSPSLNPETVRLCNRYQVPVMPGAMTIRDVLEALELGADVVKLFPGEAFGPSIIKAIKGPLPQAPLMPTGGVDLSNVAEWIKAGAVAVGAGGSLTGGARTGDFDSVTKTARSFVEKIREARAK
jgi:2-dehydro-3-deoxyphosphogluconate aldolase/(4S)-4-hydroxy-2-oxoglutarate aldolase